MVVALTTIGFQCEAILSARATACPRVNGSGSGTLWQVLAVEFVMLEVIPHKAVLVA
jgi:hypothetical protein